MRMSPNQHLTYCLNIHPGETWSDNLEAIRTHALAVRDIVAPNEPFGLGLRLSRQAAGTLMDHATRAAFKDFLEAHNVYVFTINGFPYGAFHGTRVKETVYQPDWRSRERMDYTLMLAAILADLLPDGVTGSISTVPGAYRAAMDDIRDRSAMAAALGEVAIALERLSDETNREIYLGLEPEPDCLLETTDGLIAFMEQALLATIPALCRGNDFSPSQAEAVIRRRIGLCLDTCHCAMQFEAPAAALRKAAAAGINICKIQISAALTARTPPTTRAQLAAFADETYLHQVRIRDAHGHIHRFPDLPPALAQMDTLPGPAPHEWRIHCHLPLDYTGDGPLGTTAGDLTPAFFEQTALVGIEHLEIETYTHNVLPAPLCTTELTRAIANEFAWCATRMPPTRKGDTHAAAPRKGDTHAANP